MSDTATRGATAAPPRDFWKTVSGRITLKRPLVMGILNVTPDSFSDGGELTSPERLLGRAATMVREGAAILDVGGESTRPGAEAVLEEEELRRVVPAVERLRREFDVPISVDTRKARVAKEALDAGASIVNDVSGLAFDPGMRGVVADAGAGVVIMHMRGTPADMRERATYGDVVEEVRSELLEAVESALAAGVEPATIVVDPGIGFAKTPAHSFELVAGLEGLVELGYPVMVGPSRKSFLGALVGAPPADRVVSGAVVCALAYERGARLFRVHDVRETVQSLAVAEAVTDTYRLAGKGDQHVGRVG
ncbi:MAG: dihydropteroate synthase [Gemmatimonadota bacterium]